MMSSATACASYESGKSAFYPWECVSLMRRFSTLDFIIKDDGHMMAFLNVIGRRVYQQTDSEFIKVFRKMKFKMKLSYECWRQKM